MYTTSEINIGNVPIGGKNPVRIQSMTTTNTLDTNSTVNQILDLEKQGCDLVRLAVTSVNEAENIINIQKELKNYGSNIPLIADVHYKPEVAVIAARYVDKVRVNPGNYYSSEGDCKVLEEKLLPLINTCLEHNTAIRIGVNHGSLSDRILVTYGNTPEGMVESLMEFVRIFKKHNFQNLILSVKASNVSTMISSNILLVQKLVDEGLNYPIHLGVTEAGNEVEGRVKSAIGIGQLLTIGIGDTIRVSLAENPVNEVPVAKLLATHYGRKPVKSVLNIPELVQVKNAFLKDNPEIILIKELNMLEPSSDNSYTIARLELDTLSFEEAIINASIDYASFLLDNRVDGIQIECNNLNAKSKIDIARQILQVLGLKISKAEYIACPTCSRTSIDLEKCLNQLKRETKDMVGLKFAVMGCAVNGPGEMADADYGILATSDKKVNIYQGKKIVLRNIPIDNAVAELTCFLELQKKN